MKRRKFLKNTTAMATYTLLSGFAVTAQPNKSIKKIGVQLFSLPKTLEKNFRGGIEMLSKMGYKEVELYGPFPFSVETAKARWKSVTPMLGFNGSGYFDHSGREIKTILNEFDIKATSIHTDLGTLQKRMPELGEAADILGFEYIGLPSIPEHKRTSLDGYKRMAEEFNKIGEQAKKVDLKFAYHNHGYGLQEKDGQIPLNIILDETDPNLVFFEMDVYWTIAGGANPLDYLKSYPDRYRLMHIKDMQKMVQFKGNGGKASEWIELFPYMTSAGNGVLDLKSIIETGKRMGVEHFYVEQDMVDNPAVALKKSIDYLKTI